MALSDSVPSSALDVLKRNSEDFDKVTNDAAASVTTRTGKKIITLEEYGRRFNETLANLGLEYPPIDYVAGLTVERNTQVYRFNNVLYINTRQDLPFTTTGAFDEGGWQIVQQVNQSTVIFSSDGIKGLDAVALIDRASYSVSGFYAGTEVGGGQFIYDASRPKADHNGGTVITPEAISVWDGTQANLSVLLDWTGTGTGAFVITSNFAQYSFYGSPSILANPSINKIKFEASKATITGGGEDGREQVIGFTKNLELLEAPGAIYTYPHIPVGSDLDITVLRDDGQASILTTSDYTLTINASDTTIELNTGLTSNERLLVEDRLAFSDAGGVTPQYGWIGGGYDNIIEKGLMHHVTGAHHRVIGGDHCSIFGGSYALVQDGSYASILGGTRNEINSPGSGALIAGGYRNKNYGSVTSLIGGQSNEIAGTWGAIIGGAGNYCSGTASWVGGRNSTSVGADSVVHGDANSNSAQYAQVFGKGNSLTSAATYGSAHGFDNTVSHKYSRIDGGGDATTDFAGQVVEFAGGDARKKFGLMLQQRTNGTTVEKLQTIGGVVALPIPANGAWHCRLTVMAKWSTGAVSSWSFEFLVSESAGIVGTTSKSARLDGSHSALDADISFSAGNLSVDITPRSDVAVGTNWSGWLEVVQNAAGATLFT